MTAPSVRPAIEPLLEPADDQVFVPTGAYYLGNISELFDNDTWDLLHDACGYDADDSGPVLAATVNGRHVVVIATEHGDGIFRGTDGHEYASDTGCLGLVAVGAANQELVDAGHACRMVTLTTRSLCYRDNDGTLHFGRFLIPTGDPEPETQQCTWCSEDLDELGYCPRGCGPDGPADDQDE